MSRVADATRRPESSNGPAADWQVRRASSEDVTGVVIATQELLLELGGTPPPIAELEAVVLELIADREAGLLLVARARGDVIGMLAASWQLAIHVPGRYALIQDLWVHPGRRSAAIGRELLGELARIAHERGIVRVEVGLPSEGFAQLASTEAFYLSNGFTRLGPRMRWGLS
jgi:GNAT superfamily N-acetyltransferase